MLRLGFEQKAGQRIWPPVEIAAIKSLCCATRHAVWNAVAQSSSSRTNGSTPEECSRNHPYSTNL
jgi:hypothetical protein